MSDFSIGSRSCRRSAWRCWRSSCSRSSTRSSDRSARADRHRRHRLPLSRRRRRSRRRSGTAPARRRRRRSPKCRRDRWDIDALYDPDPDAPGKMSRPPRRLPRATSTASTPQFFGISPREAATHGSAAAAAARGRLGGARARGQARRSLGGSRDRRVRRHLQRTTTSRLIQHGERSPIDAYVGTGNRRAASPPAACRMSLGLQGPASVGRHGVLLVAGRGAPGRARACGRASARWRSPAAST